MPLDLHRLDPFDDDAVDAWWEAYAAAERADRGAGATVWTREETRSELQQESAVVDRRAYLIRDAGEVLGSASLALPLKDNTGIAHLGLSVPAAHRRRGVGTRALALLEHEARSAGRTTAQASTSWPHELGPDGTGSPGREFARRHGYALALGDVMSRLDLPADERALRGHEAAAAASGRAYGMRSWVGGVPDEVIEQWAILDASLETEAPTGEKEIEAQTPDVDSIRESDDLIARQQRLSFGTIALAPDGTAAAYSQLVVSTDGNAYQWGTLVRTADRGHRLGLAVKIANLRMLQSTAPEVRSVYTHNAESNTHMLAVNALLGFRPVERLGELQKHLD
jgi:GNAT superfamily N-acetyltransferase